MAFPWMAVAQLGIGAVQSAISSSQSSNLPVPKQYTVSPELRTAYNMARRRADEGYSPEEKSAFEQMLARQGTAAKEMFRNVGLAGAGSAAANIMGTDALNQFAAQGAGIRRQNAGDFYGLANQVQGVSNMETGRFNEQLRAEEQALGSATQAGIGNMFGGFNSGMNFAQNEKAISAYQGMGVGQNSGNNAFAGGQQPQGPNPYLNNPSPMWNSFESQGIPFLPFGSQQQQVGVQPQNNATPVSASPFGSLGFGGTPDWTQLWSR